MPAETLDLNKRFRDADLVRFAAYVQNISASIGFKVSARGWCYLLEQAGMIDKSQFSKVEGWVNACRRKGFLPVDFVAEETSRAFSGIVTPSDGTIKDTLKMLCGEVARGYHYFTPDLWDGEEYYVQMLVEKIDLKTLFEPVCEDYCVPVANAKGWSSILQRAEYARRFKQAEDNGLRCVLLYCGDHDPDGLRISDTIRTNLEQVSEVEWSDGEIGYDPSNLDIVRFGLNYDFIESQGYVWIDNLITGSGLDLGDPSHKNHRLPYVKQYIRSYGRRKCEANAVVTTPDAARDLARTAIEHVVGDAASRFAEKREAVRLRYLELLDSEKLIKPLRRVIGSKQEAD